MARKSATPRKSKTTAKSTAIAKVPQSHGGALNVGGTVGNRGNPDAMGRPPSVIRETLRGTFFERVQIIQDIADGKPMQRTRVGVADLIPYLACLNCGESQIGGKDDVALSMIEVDAVISASPKDRLAALDLAAKYGLGALKEISVENVRERVAGTLDVIRSHVAPDLYQQMLPALRAQWA